MRLLVLGAGGQLGTDLLGAARSAGIEVVGASHAECDVTDIASVRETVARHRPGAVVNSAAWTRVDAAEEHEAEATAINGTGAGNVAMACAERGVRLCHVSTDYVFDGSATAPIPEDAPPHPVSAYGRSKLAGERAVHDVLGGGALIVRTAWLYGAQGPNFVLTMLRLARERGALRVVADQLGTPTWTGHLAPAILTLLRRDAAGTFHLTNGGATSWHGFATEIVSQAGLAAVPVTPIGTVEYPTPATRPPYSVLDNRHWRELGEAPLAPWEEGLRRYLESLATAAV